MKNMVNSFFFIVFILINSTILIAQDTKQIISLNIKNKTIKNKGNNTLEIEIYNQTKDTLVLPFFQENFITYEFLEMDKNVIDTHETMFQIVPSIKIKHNDKILEHIHNYIHNELDTINFNINYELNEFKRKLIIENYKKFHYPDEFSIDIHFLYNNLVYLKPYEKIVIYKTLNLENFEICTDLIYEIDKKYDGFNIFEDNCFFYIELNLEESFLNKYINFLSKYKNIKHTIYKYPLKSNDVKIEIVD
jgi:hypothetical protein